MNALSVKLIMPPVECPQSGPMPISPRILVAAEAPQRIACVPAAKLVEQASPDTRWTLGMPAPGPRVRAAPHDKAHVATAR